MPGQILRSRPHQHRGPDRFDDFLTIPLSIVSYHLETSMELLKYALQPADGVHKMHWELKIAMYQYTARERYPVGSCRPTRA